MRILYIAPVNSVHTRRWVSHFVGLGHTIEVIDSARTGESPIDGAVVHNLPWATRSSRIAKAMGYPANLSRLVRSIRGVVGQFRPDVIHIHWMSDVFGLALSLLRVHPVVATAWGSDVLVDPEKSLYHRFILRRLIRAADRFCCDAEHLIDGLVRYGATREAIELIYFGTDTQLFQPSAADPELAKELGFPEGSPLVLSNRALRPIYNVETLVRAIPSTVERVPAARFVIVGGGEERDQLEALSRSLGVSDKVVFAGRLSDDDMVRYSASATIYVSTSLSDGGLAASTAEAMACGVPVVITDFGQNAEWVERGVAGRLFPLRDSAKLADHLVDLLQHPQKRDDVGCRGMDVIRTRNDRYKEMARVETLYRSVAAATHATAMGSN